MSDVNRWSLTCFAVLILLKLLFAAYVYGTIDHEDSHIVDP